MSEYNGWRPARFDDFVPGMKKNNWAILIWTLIYLLDLVLVFVIQGLSYNLPMDEVNGLLEQVRNQEGAVQTDIFPDCQVLDGCSDMFLLRDSGGTLKLAVLKQNGILWRYKVDQTITVPEGEDVAVNVETMYSIYTLRIVEGSRIDWESTLVEQNKDPMTIFWRSLVSGHDLQINMLIAVVMLLIEYGFYCQLQKLRE